MNKQKIGLFTALLMAIGTIIGTGIFGSLPSEIEIIHSGVLIALIGATVFIILKSISVMYVSSVISANSLKFVSVTKIIHPYIGYANFIGNFNSIVMSAMYGTLFADYFLVLFPNCPISPMMISFALVVIYGVICWFGVNFAAKLNNIFVLLLGATILMFIVASLPNLDWSAIDFRKATQAGMTLTTLGASINVLHSALNGADGLINMSEEIDKPTRNIPIALILAPCLVAVVYMLMAFVTLGHMPEGELGSLAMIAEKTLSPALVLVFVVGGPIAGIVTSLLPVMLVPIFNIEVGAQLNVLPKLFLKRNKSGVTWVGLVIPTIFVLLIIMTRSPFGQLMRAFSFISNIVNLAFIILPLVLQKKYPYSCKNSFIKIPVMIINALCVACFVYTLYLMYGTFATMTPFVGGTCIALFAVGYIYFFIRVMYLKKQGIDLVAELKAPYAPWEEAEQKFAEAAKKDGK